MRDLVQRPIKRFHRDDHLRARRYPRRERRSDVPGPATSYTNIDPFTDAVYTAAGFNAIISSWATSPTVAQHSRS